MNRIFQHGIALAAFTLIGSAAVQAQTVIAHESDIAFDGVNAQYDAYDTYSSPAAVAFTPTVAIPGDASTFTWDGSGALSVSNVSTTANIGTADLALTGTGSVIAPLIGSSHYGYGSSAGQGLFSTATVSGNTVLSLTAYPADLAVAATPYTLNLAFLGDWTTDGTGLLQIDAGSFALPSNFTIVKNFVYDSGFDTTFFQATYSGNNAGSSVPEPGLGALLLGMLAPVAGFAARRRRA